MAYYLNLFSPDTYDRFLKSGQTVTGFSERQRATAANVKPGDRFIAYVTKLSRWAAILEVTSHCFVDGTPIFSDVNDPFIVRFHVKPVVCLPLDLAVPNAEDIAWNHLSFTSKFPKGSSAWTGTVRGSLKRMLDQDGEHLERILSKQLVTPKRFEITDQDKKKLQTATVKTQDAKQVTVSIPTAEESLPSPEQPAQNTRESIKIQALLAEIGERMGMKLWVPRSDRQRVLEHWKPKSPCLLEVLPLNYDDATLKTIENIDVLWIKGRSIVRAFEVEHTTSIYSGILRMADLMALQPNVNIAAHIVAPPERKEKVLQEITRPVFAFLEKGPLSESCTFISYESVMELSKERRLEHMADTVLDEYTEYAEESAY